MRLSEKGANERKTMNTHLHILEPYTNLYRVRKDEGLERQLCNLIELFMQKILDNDTFYLRLFSDDDWQNKYAVALYEHDTEASWLLYEAARVLGDAELLAEVEPVVKEIAVVAPEGFAPDGGTVCEKNLAMGHVDGDRHWWAQAETAAGYHNLFRYLGDYEALQCSAACWRFVRQHLIDGVHGKWFWSLRANGAVNRDDDEAGLRKCPYHNGRMCIELLGG